MICLRCSCSAAAWALSSGLGYCVGSATEVALILPKCCHPHRAAALGQRPVHCFTASVAGFVGASNFAKAGTLLGARRSACST